MLVFPVNIKSFSFFFSFNQLCYLLHPILPARVCVRACTRGGPTFRRLYRVAGGAGSQSLIYSGSFEIIKLTHLSDGERRNAKRSPGEVPAAPTPKPFLPPNSTVITPQQMGLLPFISAAPAHKRGPRRGERPPRFGHAQTQQGTRRSQTRGASTGRGVVSHAAAESNTKSLPLTPGQASGMRADSLRPG